jgi:TnpA family transposase
MRRGTLTQLNSTEGRHSVARVVFSGKRGELRQRYREGQEDQLGTLGLVVNMIVLWNTIVWRQSWSNFERKAIR